MDLNCKQQTLQRYMSQYGENDFFKDLALLMHKHSEEWRGADKKISHVFSHASNLIVEAGSVLEQANKKFLTDI